MSMLAAALDFARLGLAVFPVRPGNKVPAVARGCHAASREPDAIRRWWSDIPSANVAVATGAPSGAWVLDVDLHGIDGEAALAGLEHRHGDLPSTWVSATPSGGRHIWFALPPGRRTGCRVGIAPGLDVRGHGGYVVAPPSTRHDGRAYRWLCAPWTCELAQAPPWLLDLVDPPPPPKPQRPPARLLTASLRTKARYVAAAVERECQAVAGTPAGSGRNQRLFLAAARLGELVGADLLPVDLAARELEKAAHACGLVHDDGSRAVAATIASGLARGAQNPREVRA
jgi:hypothetical protein